MSKKPFFRASGFGYPPTSVYSSQRLGHWKKDSDSFKRGRFAEDVVSDGEEETRKRWKIIPSVLEGTGFTRWKDYNEHHGLKDDDKFQISDSVAKEAIQAADVLKKGMRAFGFNFNKCTKQDKISLRTGFSTEIEMFKEYDMESISGTTDFQDDNYVIDTKVFSSFPSNEYREKYKWQLSVYHHATGKMPVLMYAVKEVETFIPYFDAPSVYSMADIISRKLDLVPMLGFIERTMNLPNEESIH